MTTKAPRKSARTSRVNDPERTKNDILDVAAEHFSTAGLSGSRVDEIAAETHTSKRMLYYYFGNKEGLYRSVLARSYEAIREHERGLDVATLPPREAMTKLVEATFDYHHGHPSFVRIVMNENIHQGAHISEVPEISQGSRSVLSIIADLLDRGIKDGVFRSGLDPLDVHFTMSALSFYNVSNRYTLSHLFGRNMADSKVVARRRAIVVDTVLRWISV